MLVFIGKLSLSTNIRVPICHGFSHFSAFFPHHIVLNKLATSILNDAKKLKMTETLANGYSSESTQRELFNEYQYDRV